MPRLKAIAAIALVLLALLGGCTAVAAPDTGGPATVVVTLDFGRETLLEDTVAVDADTSAMAALKAVAEVTTKYGGGFVASINGISTEYEGGDSAKKDWFYYVNGIQSGLGAIDYALRAGDVEQWDFRDWSYQRNIPAIVGAYPQPFLSGFQGNLRPTLVVYEDTFAAEAEALAESLRDTGVGQVSAVSYDQLSDEDKQNSNLLIIAWLDNPLLAEMNDIHKKLGFYAHFEGGELVVLDAVGDEVGRYGGGSGLIQATQNPWNPKGTAAGENVAWMVTGADADGIRAAAAVLTERADELRGAFAVMILNDEIIRIP